ncbi:MAG: EAL domain-containing protein, partial [Burkholderiaceae bacterium]|nr:EAL domain-containing protein [Burkholderiaceae bacterium]
RIGASVAVFTDPHMRLVASTLVDGDQGLSLVRARAQSTVVTPQDSTVRVLDGQPFQLVTVPVNAPTLIGHVSMGFPLNERLLRDMEEVSSLKMGLMLRLQGGTWRALPIGEHASALQPIAAQLTRGTPLRTLALYGDENGAHLVTIGGNATDEEVVAVLLRSVDEALAPYRRLEIFLLAIALAGLTVFGVGSVITARRITGPIKALSQSALKLGAGEYATPVQVTSHDEIHDLAQSFEAMRNGIQQREVQIARLAYWDTLTGLPNREQFRDLLRDRIERARAAGETCAVVIFDLDRFKHVNDILGHAFGDRLLCQIAARLQHGVMREQDVLARFGGDEFVVCLPQADADTGSDTARRIRHALEQPLTLDDHTVDVGAGAGVASFPKDGDDADTLLGRAEVAMYAAKSKQSGVVVYDPTLDSSSQHSLSLLTELRTAVDNEQLRLFLQPKIALDSGRVVGAEALVRWQHPQRGMVQPMQFIPFAEQTGFIRVLTGWMIEQCSSRSRTLRAQGLDLKFAINLSTRDLLDQDLPARLERLLACDAMDPRLLCMEITESAIMDDPQRAMRTLRQLHDMGLRLSIDDFGTGYSSLAYLKLLPIHELKIDKSFVMAMERDRADLKIVRSTIDLAHNLGLSVVAEGVENAQTWAVLSALKCDEAQGYFMAKPMPEADFADWMATWKPPEVKLASVFATLV